MRKLIVPLLALVVIFASACSSSEGENTAGDDAGNADPMAGNLLAACDAVLVLSSSLTGSFAELTTAIRALDAATESADIRSDVIPILRYGSAIEDDAAARPPGAGSDGPTAEVSAAFHAAEPSWQKIALWATERCEPDQPIWMCFEPLGWEKLDSPEAPEASDKAVEFQINESGLAARSEQILGGVTSGFDCNEREEQPFDTVPNEIIDG